MKFIFTIVIGIILIQAIIFFESKEIYVGTNIGWTLFGLYLPCFWQKFIDCFDTTSWKSDLRNLTRGKELRKNDMIRISFAYLFRIQVDDKYLLVLNDRGTDKYQPVGGAYHYNEEEGIYLKNNYKIAYDDKITRDKYSQNDYRLHVPVKYFRSFMKRFDKTSNRESVNDLSREFKEELIVPGILKFTEIEYRFCGRHFSKISYSRHFNCYELLLADIVELKPTESQLKELRNLSEKKSKQYRFVTAKEIKSCGIFEGTNKLKENIGDHTVKILQENEIELLNIKGSLKMYKVNLSLESQ